MFALADIGSKAVTWPVSQFPDKSFGTAVLPSRLGPKSTDPPPFLVSGACRLIIRQSARTRSVSHAYYAYDKEKVRWIRSDFGPSTFRNLQLRLQCELARGFRGESQPLDSVFASWENTPAKIEPRHSLRGVFTKKLQKRADFARGTCPSFATTVGRKAALKFCFFGALK